MEEVFENFYQKYEELNQNQAVLFFSFLYEVPWILKWSYSIDDHIGTGCHCLFRNVVLKWWPKFDVEKLISASVPNSKAPCDSASPSKKEVRKLVNKALKKVSKEEILKYLEEDDDDDDSSSGSMDVSESSQDPFGGPCAQPQ